MVKKRFTLNTDSMDRYYQITDEVTGDLFDVYKLSQCETLCDLLNALHEENEQLKEENKALKTRREFLELLTTYRGEMVSMANSIIQDLPNTPTVKAQEMWYEFKEEMYQEWKKKRGIE